ncbi:hypothetical protein MK904_11495 [Loigolactobacillus coryniformis]|uniref:hypothetical protein n=1 Tax=Loigolactobacillus coryniformis TaxID=1610 RepID=UPI0023420B12|nr:hypothetical protein [Loigolactobacillus coryniformis]MDC4186713.1 hypothetical protein [Loigolactobacillus coryniformis]
MKRPAFTLLESIVVLSLVVGFALIPVTQFGPIKQQHAEQLFLSHFDQEWRYLQAYALLRGERVQIHVQRQQVVFRIFSGQDWATQKILAMPLGMHADGHAILIDPSGHIGPTTINFKSEYFHRVTSIKPQMGWGTYE